jgi:hypothetical protein
MDPRRFDRLIHALSAVDTHRAALAALLATAGSAGATDPSSAGVGVTESRREGQGLKGLLRARDLRLGTGR